MSLAGIACILHNYPNEPKYTLLPSKSPTRVGIGT